MELCSPDKQVQSLGFGEGKNTSKLKTHVPKPKLLSATDLLLKRPSDNEVRSKWDYLPSLKFFDEGVHLHRQNPFLATTRLSDWEKHVSMTWLPFPFHPPDFAREYLL